MARNSVSRFRSNLTIIFAVALFCILGIAASRSEMASGGAFAASARSGSSDTTKPLSPRPTINGQRGSQQLAPLADRSTIVFGSGSDTVALLSITNVGTQNDVTLLTYTHERDPVFSPDGNKVAFFSYRDGEGGSGIHQIYSMNPNGMDQTRLTNMAGYKESMIYSPDSSKIAFINDADLWSMNADGSGAATILDKDNTISDPQYSPDGNTIIFIYDNHLWRVDPDGLNASQIVSQNYIYHARFSPDGTKIIYSSSDSDIYTMNANGTGEQMIIDHVEVSYSLQDPKYSPDGTKILMQCSNGEANICTADSDGQNFAALGGSVLDRANPAWSPDSSEIAFIARDSADNTSGVYVATIGGQPARIYGEGPGSQLNYLVWQPECPGTVPTPTPTPTPSGTPIPGLISEWNANGLNANDSQGLNNGQFVHNAALIDPGKRGLGFYFYDDGSDTDGGYIEIPDSISLDVQTGDYTLSTWFESNQAAEHYVAGKGACNGSGSNFYIGVDSSFVPFIDISHENGGSRASNDAFTLSQNVWHNLILIKEGTSFKLYVDGVLALNHTETGTMGVNDQPFTIGKGIGCIAPQLTTKGGVDEVLLFGRALNATELDAIYNGYYPPAGPTPTPTPTNGGLVGFWRANGNANDSSGGNNGSLEGNTAYATGHEGQAFDFDGNGDRVRVLDGGSDVLDVQTGDFTVAAWVYIRSSGEHFIAGKDSGDGSYSLKVIGQQLNFCLFNNGGGSCINTGADVTQNVWHHVAGVRSNGQIRVFVDGTERSSTDFTDTLPAISTDFTIGSPVYTTSPQPDTNGLIDDVRLYNRGLDGTEMIAIYNDSGFAPRVFGAKSVGGVMPIAGGPACQAPADPAVELRVNWPHPVAAGRTASINIHLKDDASAGGTTVALAYPNSGIVDGPPSVTILQGHDQVNFDVTTTMSSEYRVGDVIATLGTETARVTVTVEPAAPDVAVSNFVAPPTVAILQNFTASWRVTNNGQIATDDYRTDTLYISTDNVLFNSPNDVVVGRKYENGAVIAPGAFRDVTFEQANIPAAAIPTDGTYYLFVLVGDAGTVRERNGNGNDNYSSVPITVNRNLPDLVAQNIVAPTEIEPNVLYTISWDVKNAGSVAINSGSNHTPYFSYDDVIGNADDVPLTYRRLGAIGINETQSFSQQFILPTVPARSSGDGKFYVKVDTANEIYEDFPTGPAELNNTTWIPVRYEYRVADLQVVSVTPPAEVESDTVFALNWTTQNTGSKTAQSMAERVYFSTDNVVSGNDVLLDTFTLEQTLEPGQSVNRSQNVSIPTNAITATGNYFIYVVTDVFNVVNEGANDGNNTTFSPLRVRRLLRPDLQVTNITAPATAFFDQEVQVQFTVTNTGSGPTNATGWTDELYLAVNQTLNGANVLTRAQNVSSLNPGESYVTSLTVRIPRSLQGSFYFLVQTDRNSDGGQEVNEENENNNISTRPLTVSVPPVPDLRASNVQAPIEAFGGQSMLVNWTVTNNGDGATPPATPTWNDVVYLSKDQTLDGADRYVGLRPHTGVLAVNASYTVSGFSLNLPPDVFGDYYVFVVADGQTQVFEFTNEGNNSDYDRVGDGSPLHVVGAPPDFTIVDPLSAPTNANAGGTFNVNYTVRNQGAFDAVGPWFDAVFLSPTPQFDVTTAIFLGNTYHNGLVAGQQYGVSQSVTIPNCLDGTYYLIARADTNGSIFEWDPNIDAELNNFSAAKQITISNFAPDLRVKEMTIPPVVIDGVTPINWTVRNYGTAATLQTSWVDRVFIYDGSQFRVLGDFPHTGALAVDGEYFQNQIVYLPHNIEGSVQIFVQTDAYGNVPECSLDDNNTDARLTDAQGNFPDLSITSANNPSSAQLGSTVSVSWNGINTGDAMQSATSWADRVYISSDQTLGPGDTSVGSQVFNTQLGANGIYNGSSQITIPNLPAGGYYLIFQADAGNNIEEGTRENNNSLALPITLTLPNIDLLPTTPTVAPVLYSGQFADVSWTVNNVGANATVSTQWYDHIVLSRDLIIDQNDRILDRVLHSGSLAGGAGYSVTRSVRIPEGLTGEYKILVIADRNNYVVESNENNNISPPATVDLQLPPPAELNITHIAPPVSVGLGESAIFEWTVQNSSANAASGVWQDSVYFSADATWDSSDTFIGARQHNVSVAPFGTYTETLESVIPPIETGSYYVIVRTDARNTIRESNEGNNVSSSVSQTAVTIPTLTLGNVLNTSLATGQERFYSIFNVPADETMLVTLTGEAGSSNELYTRFNNMVSRANYEIQGTRQGEPDQENLVGNTFPGKYNTMIRGDYVPNSFAEQLKVADTRKAKADQLAQQVALKAELLPFGIRRVSPGTAGNNGYSMISVEGAKFQPGASIKLVNIADSTVIVPMQTFDISSINTAGLFNLNGAEPGNYNVVLTNPNSQTSTWSQNFVITKGGGESLRTEITGPGEVRGNFYTRYTISVSNEGKNDAITVPIIVRLSAAAMNYRLSTANYYEFAPADDTVDPNTVHADRNGERILALFAPIVRAGETVNIGIDVSFANRGTITAEALGGVFDPALASVPLDQLIASASGRDVLKCWTNLAFNTLLAALSEIFPIKCAAGIAKVIGAAFLGDAITSAAGGARTGDFVSWSTLWGLAAKAMRAAEECAFEGLKYFPLAKIASIIFDIYQLLALGAECLKLTAEYVLPVHTNLPNDPNDKVGPYGYGPEKFVPIGKPLPYRINFENKSSATAPAHRIRTVDQLPATLDPRTVRLTEIGFKQYRIVIPPNRSFYQTRMQLGPDLDNLQADITAGVNVATGAVTLTMIAIDPATGEEPIDPGRGLLPPNNATNDGQGYLAFTVIPTANQLTRTDIANTATIYFDDNEPLVTNTTTNLIDADIPVSQFAALPATGGDPSFPINWSGSDDGNGSGLKGFDVFASESGGAFLPFISDSTSTSGVFNGRYGRTYQFYSVASDNAGNYESAPVTPDATIRILGSAVESDVAGYPTGDNDGLVNDSDVSQVRRFAAKLDQANTFNDFQAADSSPSADGGNGSLSVGDVMQSRRFALGLDPLQDYQGPISSGTLTGKPITGSSNGLLPRGITPYTVSRIGNKLTVAISLEAQGDETGVGFTLNYNTSDLANPQNISLGEDAAGAVLTANTGQAGKVGLIIDKLPSQPFSAGGKYIAKIEFDVISANATTMISFGDDPVAGEIVNGGAFALASTFSDATITMLGPTAAGVSVAGTVKTAGGRPIGNTVIFLADDLGVKRRAITNPFGQYRFDDVEAGRSYVIGAKHKTFHFANASYVITVTDAIGNADFVAQE
ncbi:MAG TPA: CARDB domain-containing protein [Pyrinomonadaceae bacterium]|mgnify:CR=1 FL=1|nr:PD40 domain-containing protein [Chloracidobacterium sp.]MBP9936359.1 PD40 domain-containing protein [Pyrinomonadaceae bacterium]HQX55000.1 CARDB domain-containing protein [Pyrinomonadaceae bacterium]HQY68379.1 CARDB domain-containing protein [Pyrinomonadaceae bacterium]HRA40091.1 CARDB domain-containing protein [Pyrinomonadaceae bacterium]